MAIRILLVDDSTYFLDVACDYLRLHEDMEIIGTAMEATEALAQAASLQPDVILLDLNLGAQSGMRLIPHFKQAAPNAIIIILTMMSDASYRISALKAGADAFVNKASMTEQLVSAIHTLTHTGQPVSPTQPTKPAASEASGIFMRLAEQFSDMIYRYEITPNPCFTYVSPSSAQITGYSPEEFYADPNLGYKLVHPEDRQIAIEMDKGISDSSQPFILRWVRKDGSIIWCEQRHVRVFNEAGELIAREGIARDITSRRQAERALRQSEMRFEAIFRSNPAAIAMTRIDDNTLVDVNSAWEQVSGYSRAEALGFSPVNLNLWVNPLQRQQLHNNMLENGHARCDAKIRRKDGQIREALMEAQLMEIAGEYFMLSMATDFTERKQVEEQAARNQAILSSVIESSRMPILSLDRELRYTCYNQAHAAIMKELYGVDIHVGDSILECQKNPTDREVTRANLERALTGEQFTILNSITEDNHSRRFFEVTYNPIFNRSNELTGVAVFVQETTDSKRSVERELVQTAALEAAANAMMITNREGRIEWVNPAWSALTGYSFEESIGQGLSLNDPARLDEAYMQARKETIQAGKVWRGEKPSQRKDGSLYEEEETITPVKDSAGDVTHFISIKLNITNRKRAQRLLEARLRLSSLSYQLNLHDFLQKTLDEAEYLTNSDIGFFHFIEGDSELIHLQAWSSNTINTMCEINARGLHYPKEKAGIWAEAIFDGQPHIYNDYPQLQYKKGLPEGHAPIQHFITIPLVREGNVVAVLGVGNNATRYNQRDIEIVQQLVGEAWEIIMRMRTEAELRRRFTDLEALHENGLILGQLLSEEEISRQMILLLEEKLEWHHAAIRAYRPEKGRIDLLAASESDRLQYSITQLGEGLSGWVIQNGQSVRSGDVRQDPRYKEVYTEIRSGMYVPIFSGHQVVGCITVESEQENAFTENDERLLITLANQAGVAISQARMFYELQSELIERRMAEEQVRRLNLQLEQRVADRTADLSRVNSELERALRVKDEFLASMSHELRTPLTGILGMSEALQEDTYGALNERQAKSIEMIERSGRHLLDLINDILDLSKIEAGKLELQPETIYVPDVCQASLEMVKGLAYQKQQKISFVHSPITMRADQRRLKQMLVNLLSNAIKFTPEGGKLGLIVDAYPDKKLVSFTVWDKGVGITPEDIERLFQPFIQLESSLSQHISGTGLGLALVKRMAELHGGSVRVESTPGQGSQFIITLPWQQEQAQEADLVVDENRPGQLVPEHKTNGSQLTLLLVDDLETAITPVRDYLEYAGYHVEVAFDGQDAIEAAVRIRPDLILMDVQMPVIDGLAATRILRSQPACANTPIIAITAQAMPGDRERCLEAGMNEYITKPVSLKNLLIVIRNLLAQSR